MGLKTYPKNEMVDNIFLFGWGCAVALILMMTLLDYLKKNKDKKTRAYSIKPQAKVMPESEKRSTFIKPNKKTRTHIVKKVNSDPFLFDYFSRTGKESKASSKAKPQKSAKQEDTQKTDSIQTAPAFNTTLPSEIRFSEQYIYPSKSNGQFPLFPLPGFQRSTPVANITIHGRLMPVYDTQFGVLVTDDFPDESRASVHRRCLENGQVVFAKNLGLFKTHPARTAGDERVIATHRIIHPDGLTLHLFDKAEQHAHTKK